MQDPTRIESLPTVRRTGLRNSTGWGCVLLVLLTLVVYLPALQCGFIWDDDDHFTENPAMQSAAGLQQIWSSLAVSRYYPLTLTNFWIQHRLWGLNPLPYHLVNIVFHALNGILVFLVLRRLRIPPAWLAATLWVLHPVNVESVAWVTELKNLQSGAFFFFAVLCYLRFEATGRRRWYAWALVCGAGAMLSKPSTVVLPVVLLLCGWWERRCWRWNDLVRIVPFLVMTVGMSMLTIIEQQRHIARAGAAEWSFAIADRWIIAGKSVWFYVAKVLWPANLAFIYPRWEVTANALESWLPLAGVVAGGFSLWVWRRQPWAQAAFFGLGYFGVALLPVLGFMDVYFFQYSFVADHFQYLASIGLIALLAGAGAIVTQWMGRWGQTFGGVVAATVILLFGACTWRQIPIYQNPETLWRDTLSKNPQAWMAHNNLGNVLVLQGQPAAAMDHYQTALRLKPDYAVAHYNLGNALAAQGQTAAAIGWYQAALRLKPDYAQAHNNLGNALAALGQTKVAIDRYREALRLKPDYVDAHNNLGAAFAVQGQTAAAIEQYQAALRLKPDFAEAHCNLGEALAAQGQIAAAIERYQEALRLKPDYPQAQTNLALALKGKTGE